MVCIFHGCIRGWDKGWDRSRDCRSARSGRRARVTATSKLITSFTRRNVRSLALRVPLRPFLGGSCPSKLRYFPLWRFSHTKLDTLSHRCALGDCKETKRVCKLAHVCSIQIKMLWPAWRICLPSLPPPPRSLFECGLWVARPDATSRLAAVPLAHSL